jgi:hypothetical protein
MALSAHARRVLRAGLCSAAAADDFADVVDAGSGTIDVHTFNRIVYGTGNRKASALIQTAVNAGTALNGYAQRHLSNLCGDAGVAAEIAAALAAE